METLGAIVTSRILIFCSIGFDFGILVSRQTIYILAFLGFRILENHILVSLDFRILENHGFVVLESLFLDHKKSHFGWPLIDFLITARRCAKFIETQRAFGVAVVKCIF